MTAFSLWTALSSLIFFATLAAMEWGWRIGRGRIRRDGEASSSGTGTIDGAIFGLMGLLIAFSFSGAASRFDDRRNLILEESNTIGTAYLRLDLLPAEARATLKEDFRQYVDSRLAIYRALPDLDAAMSEFRKSAEIQSRIWSRAVEATKQASPAATTLVLSTLNDMIDITQTRLVATRMHPPAIIYVVLVVMVLASSLLAGYNMAAAKIRNWTYRITFAALMTMALFLIVDLEFPRFGFIRVESFDQLLVDLRNGMK